MIDWDIRILFILIIDFLISFTIWTKKYSFLKVKRKIEFNLAWIVNGWIGFIISLFLISRIIDSYVLILLSSVIIIYSYSQLIGEYYRKKFHNL